MTAPAPEALMLLGSRCPYCPSVLEGLSQLVKKGEIGQLTVINVEQNPEIAREIGVRSVPWVRIGPFELEGQQTPAELASWAKRAASNEGIREYIAALLNTGGIAKAETLILENPGYFSYLLELFTDDTTSLNIRVGIGALMEMLAETDFLLSHIEQLGELTQHDKPQVRIDACHYLSLTRERSAVPFVEQLLNDDDATVREVAKESLEALSSP